MATKTPEASPNTRIVVHLDEARTISYTVLAQYRMGTLPHPFALTDIADRKRTMAAVIAWVWACLVPEDAAEFKAPEDIVPHVTMAKLPELIAALGQAVKAATVTEKNGHGSTPKRSPSSS